MIVADFLRKVEEQPGLEVVYCDPTICIIRCPGLSPSQGTRCVRLGLWAVRRMYWEQIAEAMGILAQVTQ
jgi:hypothetical protein